MKTRVWIVLLAALLVVSLGLSVLLMMPGEDATHAQILSGGKLLHTVDLRIDREIRIDTEDGGYNIVAVRDGKIGVTEATCPDHYCMHRGFCNSGAQIVCLPNKLVIQFVENQEVDMVVG